MLTKKSSPAGAPIAACAIDHGCTPVACGTCLAEIPGDLAMSFEGPDYVHHFCGLECLARWKEQQDTKE